MKIEELRVCATVARPVRARRVGPAPRGGLTLAVPANASRAARDDAGDRAAIVAS